MKYKYKLSGLDCANCANAIETKLNNDERIDSAIVNFSKLTVTVVSSDKNVRDIVEKVTHLVEPDVKVLDMNEEAKNSSKIKFHILRLIIGIVLSILGMYIFKGTFGNVLIILSYVVLLYRTFTNAVKLLFKSKTINENLLVTISCIGAYFTDNIHEGLMVIVLYEIGKILEEIAVNNSRKSISDLMDIKPEYANLVEKDNVIKTDPKNIKIGDIIVVKKGEKIPLDGVITDGKAKLNTAFLTGESKLREVRENDEVLSGSINEGGLIYIKVTSFYENSTVSRILELTENASDRKAKTETFVAKAAKVYTPVVLGLAILIFIVLTCFTNLGFNESIYRALVFLVVSCPCAIAISVPLSYFSGIGKASKEGILVKGSDYLDSLSDIGKIIFDKTGTITTGKFSDYKITILNDKYKEKDIIKYYVSGEKYSNHPVAKSIVSLFGNVKTSKIEGFKEATGKGISYKLKEDKIFIGSSSYVGIKKKDSLIYLKINKDVVASIELIDGIKKDSKKAISLLKKMNIKTLMFTGDDEKIAKEIASEVGIENYVSEMLPEDKYHALESEIKRNDKKTAFVGDGINDTPSLALSDIGISMGSIGSQSAIEASDVVIMNDELTKVADAIKISKITKKIIKQNLIFAISVKVIVLILSAFGIASMWQAVFADTGVTLLTILNTTRILRR